jgi:1-deoxy-D-xylulose-5-phosphate synthase
MSISPPVGALNKYLARLMSGQFYEAARQGAKAVLKNAPPLFELARRFEEHAKGMVVPGTIFEEFGFNYVGPIDGHDLDSLVPTLENLRAKRGPQFLHVVTKKGQGYNFAEEDPVKYHAASAKFDPAEGFAPAKPGRPAFMHIFGQWLCDMAQADPKLVAITPAMREGSGMVEFHKRFPKRYYDVGIAEQHAVTFAAGLACEGLKPVVAIYSTFLQRGYDQLIHDVALQNLPVVFALDRAGIVGADGPTHAGAYDIAYVRCVPNMSMLTPSDENECRQALTTAYRQNHPVAVRYPRGAGAGVAVEAQARQAHCRVGLWHLAAPGAEGGRKPGCFCGRHAFCQAAGQRLGAGAGTHARSAGDGGRRLRDGWCWQCRAGMPGRCWCAGACVEPGLARCVCGAW